jgi:hypothetical protein
VQSETFGALQRYIGRLDTLALYIEQHVDIVCVPVFKCQFYERDITFILNLLAILLLGSYCRVMVTLQTVLVEGILFEADKIVDSVCDGVEYFHSNTQLFSVRKNLYIFFYLSKIYTKILLISHASMFHSSESSTEYTVFKGLSFV